MQEINGPLAELNRRGLAAAATLASRLGLPAGDPVVLSGRGNLLVRLAPAPVVARVATGSAWSRADPFAWLTREVAVARYIADLGGPVVAPTTAAEPGPHWQDGFAISLWECVRPSGRQPGPAETGAALAALHEAARDCPAELGELSTVREQISEGIDALERAAAADPETVAALRAAHARALAGLAGAGSASVVLHGDAHAGNLLWTAARGFVWTDLEETCRGPVEWDLATLSRAYQDPAAQQAALRGYAARAGGCVPDLITLLPFVRARELEGAVWSLCMAHLYPARYREVAAQLLAIVLAEPGARGQ